LFQLAGLETALQQVGRVGEYGVGFGFPDLRPDYSSEKVKITFLKHPRFKLGRWIRSKLAGIARNAAKRRLFSEIWVDLRTNTFVRTRALFPAVGVITNRFMQVAGLADVTFARRLADKLGDRAGPASTSDMQDFLFVHVRRGDYLTWPQDQPAALPSAYFSALLDYFRSERPELDIKLFTDNPGWAATQPEFAGIPPQSAGALGAFELMSTAKAGILSASSLSYWSALVAKQRDPMAGPFIAPKYWAGWPKRSWYPRNLQSREIEYVDVDELSLGRNPSAGWNPKT
jgi:hypothetical protein